MTDAGHLNTYAAIRLLADAGVAGLTTTEIAVQFTSHRTHMARSNRANQIMRQLEKQGLARAGEKEPTSIDTRALPVRRWFATEATQAYVDAGPNDNATREAKRLAKIAEWQAAAAAARARQEASLEAARTAVAERIATRSLTRCWRYDKITELRGVPNTLADIGEVFGITRERVRQIEAGREDPCRCQDCEARTRAALSG